MRLGPYLTFNGQCEEAFKFYEKLLGAKITFIMTHEGSPMAGSVPPEWGKKIMHATLAVGDQLLQASDAPPAHYERPQGFCVTLGIKEPAEAERIYNALAEGGTVKMPLQETFWALKFATFVDRFGIPWIINCEKPI